MRINVSKAQKIIAEKNKISIISNDYSDGILGEQVELYCVLR
jgi:hypothetical protein